MGNKVTLQVELIIDMGDDDICGDNDAVAVEAGFNRFLKDMAVSYLPHDGDSYLRACKVLSLEVKGYKTEPR